MKNILLLAAFVMTASFATAQKTCSKTCASKKATTEASAESATVLSAQAIAELADFAAKNDESIERKECSVSGKVSYFQKSECAKSGKISMNEVKYCTDSKAFVNASPSDVMSAEGEAEAVKTSESTSGTKKACSAGQKSCAKTCAGKASASVDATAAPTVLSAQAIAELADFAAKEDASIERRECSISGKVAYFQKSECAKSGKISMNEVKYCTDSKAFVNASPSDVMSAEGEAKVIKTAETVDGKVQSSGTKKACCKGKKQCGSKKTGA